MRVKGTLSISTSCGSTAGLKTNAKYEIAKMYDYETLSDTFMAGPQEPYAIGNTLTETSMRWPPEPRITPSTGATSV